MRRAASIPTRTDVSNARRRASRRAINAARLLAEMKRGACLHLQHANGRQLWSLSSGEFVAADLAAIITRHASVVSVGDALFADVPAQTWRLIHD